MKNQEILNIKSKLDQTGEIIFDFCIDFILALKIDIKSIIHFINLISIDEKGLDIEYLMRLFFYANPDNTELKNKYNKIKEIDLIVLNDEIKTIKNYLPIENQEFLQDNNEEKSFRKKRIEEALKESVQSDEPILLDKQDFSILLEEIPDCLKNRKNKWIYPYNDTMYEDFRKIFKYFEYLPKGYLMNYKYVFYASNKTYKILYEAMKEE